MSEVDKLKYDLDYTNYVYFKLEKEKDNIENEFKEYKLITEIELKKLKQKYNNVNDEKEMITAKANNIIWNLKYENKRLEKENELLNKELDLIKDRLFYLEKKNSERWF